jgi:hypothetical protein
MTAAAGHSSTRATAASIRNCPAGTDAPADEVAHRNPLASSGAAVQSTS